MLMVYNSFSYNLIEYFTYLNIWLLYLWFLLMIMFIMINSCLLYYITLKFNDMLIEFLFILFSLWLLLMIISPSLIMLLDYNLILMPYFLIYCLGYQWAWTFNLNNLLIYYYFDHYLFMSYYNSYFYLFDLNRYIIFPIWSSFKINLLSFDVIHCLGLFSFGIKIDGIPGRMHLGSIMRSIFKGEHKGFCFELCGQGHSTMLIAGMIMMWFFTLIQSGCFYPINRMENIFIIAFLYLY